MSSLDGRRFRAVADVAGGDADGRLRLHETWAWDSQAGSGTSVVEEIL
ncbi:MAG TPA: hypothetical protein VF080_01770 [Solirubrobacteraceae bacterium]